ncbi:ECF transporter S component [Enterococcus gallinarum]|uniref:ECF transporter S component n=1 Tax=Enterococcus gallinarum TaxID=1353 RepID=UPI001D1782FE|nr:ECF transporter S component [Enterococcus gallinarum]MCC4046308.1 ECF transporter S component [Enterococcus gallinarum]
MSTKKLTTLAMLTALTTALSLLFVLPVPQTKGVVTLCEAGIYTTALLLSGPSGAIVGSLSGGMIDFLSGYPEWALFSILIHGCQGYLTGRFRHYPLLALCLGSVTMILGYAAATTIMFGFGAGIASILSNSLQNVFGILVAFPLVNYLKRTQKFSLNER